MDSDAASDSQVVLLSLESSEGDEAAHHSVLTHVRCSSTDTVGGSGVSVTGTHNLDGVRSHGSGVLDDSRSVPSNSHVVTSFEGSGDTGTTGSSSKGKAEGL